MHVCAKYMSDSILPIDSKDVGTLPEDAVLVVDGVSKKFCRNLRRSMLYGMRDLAGNLLGGAAKQFLKQGAVQVDHQLRRDEFWALKDMSFTLKRGEALGLIGHNGSGKTTLLRLLTGIFPPDDGLIAIRGRVGALIALGAGFHPHMTGRENIYLNGAILGMGRAEVDAKFEEIVNFSEVREFLDAPVSTYSSGMFARLGFSIAVHVKPDLLLVDEVLSVGDMAFQAKCNELMHDYVKRGGSIVFVSHNMNAVQGLCSRVIWMDHGRCRQVGDASSVVGSYLAEMDDQYREMSLADIRRDNKGTGDIRIIKMVLRNREGKQVASLHSGEALTAELHYEAMSRINQPYFLFGIGSRYGGVLGASMLFDGFRPDVIEGQGVIRCIFSLPFLMPQVYWVSVGIRASDGVTFLVETRKIACFTIKTSIKELGFSGEVAESLARDSAPVIIQYEWELPGGRKYRHECKVLTELESET